MNTPLKLFTLWACCCFMACCSTSRYSSGRHRQSEVKQRLEERVLDFRAKSVEQLDSLSVAQVHRAYQQLEAVAIVPMGRFSYHPDSGFSGQAEKVVIYGKRNVVYDSLQNEHRRHLLWEKHELRDSVHTREAQRHEVKTVERTGIIGWGWWLAAVAVMVFIILGWVVRKHSKLWKLWGFLFPGKSG